MNRKQVAYQIGRAKSPEIFATMWAACWAPDIFSLAHGQEIPFWRTAGTLALGVGMGCLVYRDLLTRFLLYQENKRIKGCPLENTTTIKIEDKEGLRRILERTGNSENREWGTCLKVSAKEDAAIISEILDPEEAEELGLIEDRRRASLILNLGEAKKEGYNGYQHFHPDFLTFNNGEMNYSVSTIDRYTGPNWINLLTFNTSDGPEIIGFNRNHTYIPTDKSKAQLVRATPKDIMRYLAD